MSMTELQMSSKRLSYVSPRNSSIPLKQQVPPPHGFSFFNSAINNYRMLMMKAQISIYIQARLCEKVMPTH